MPRPATMLLLLTTAALTAPAFCALPGAAAVAHNAPRPKPGDILRIFDNARLLIVTNADTALTDSLLEGCHQRERRILSVAEWRKLPADTHWAATTVFLIDRERLTDMNPLPRNCPAERDEVYTAVTHQKTSSGINHEIILSAPDSAWLKQILFEFRGRSEVPRQPEKRNVRSLAIIPSGGGAVGAATPLLAKKPASSPCAHLLPVDLVMATEPRRIDMDELFLIDRSIAPSPETASMLATLTNGRTIGTNDTVIWKETRENGRSRIVLSAPTADLLAEAVRRYPDPLSAPETPTIVMAARDLRTVRRIAVATVKTSAGGPELSRRLASKAATDLRSLDAFEVLERAGLSEMLGEIALGQAGITQSGERSRVRQMAAADALLILEITGVNGKTEYVATHDRLTAPMGRPPQRPLEPSRLKYSITIPGKENDAFVRNVTDSLLSRAVGTKTESEYKDDLRRFNRETLPRWQREKDQYEEERRRRTVSWKQNLTAHSEASVSGSLRLIDMTDGLVLWETPFTASSREETPKEARTVTTYGDDSKPDPTDVPATTEDAPASLIDQAADEALTQGILALKGTALLPTTNVIGAAGPDTAPATGRLLDVDAGTLLIGLGAGDGLKLGDALKLALPDGQTVRLLITRVRPRTCDAVFDKAAPLSLRTRATVGLSVTKENP